MPARYGFTLAERGRWIVVNRFTTAPAIVNAMGFEENCEEFRSD